MQDSSISLTLTPVGARLGTEKIAVEKFPFLIGREEAIFTRYRHRISNRINVLSRKHAQIYMENGKFYLQDLGSSNGTTLAGKQVTDQPIPIQDGDQVTFAETFSFKIGIIQPAIPPKAADWEEGKTVFMSTPKSFLKVLSQQTDKAESYNPPDPSIEPPQPQGDQKKPVIEALLKNFTNLKAKQHSRWYLLGLLGVLLIIVLGWVVLGNSPERKLQKLLAQGRPTECLVATDVMLSKKPGNPDLRTLATEALLACIASDWVSKLDKALFAEAREILVDLEARSKHNPDGLKMIGLLDWVVDLEQFASGKSTASQIVLFKDEDQIESLLDRWDKNESENRRLLDQVGDQDVSLARIRERVFNKLNLVRSTMAIHLPAIRELTNAIQKQLNADQPQALIPVLAEFEKQFPKVGGIALLRNDLKDYITLWRAIEAKRLLETSNRLRVGRFRTQPFIAKFADLRINFLPSNQVMQGYSRAAKAWASGDGQGTIAILEPLIDQKWGEVALKEIHRCRDVLKKMARLENAKGNAEHEKALLALHHTLNPEKDTFYLNQLEKDFSKIRTRELSRAKELFMLAEKQWQAYVGCGRISGLLRIENSVSETFRQQTHRLVSSASNASMGNKIYQQHNQVPPRAWTALESQILDEIEIQQMRLNDMAGIMDPALLAEKRKLLTLPSNGNAS